MFDTFFINSITNNIDDNTNSNTIDNNTIFINDNVSFNYQFQTNVSITKYKRVPEEFTGKIAKKSVHHFPILYKKHHAINQLLTILKMERKHHQSKLYHQVIGSFVGTLTKNITYGDNFLNVIKEYYNTDLYTIPNNSYPMSFYNMNLNLNYFFYIYRFTYYNTDNDFIQIDINEYYLI